MNNLFFFILFFNLQPTAYSQNKSIYYFKYTKRIIKKTKSALILLINNFDMIL